MRTVPRAVVGVTLVSVFSSCHRLVQGWYGVALSRHCFYYMYTVLQYMTYYYCTTLSV